MQVTLTDKTNINAEVTIEVESVSLDSHVLRDHTSKPIAIYDGRWWKRDGLVYTSIVIKG